MIIRIIAIDPDPKDPRDDVIVYQVPEKSRAHELLVELLERHGIEYVEMEPTVTRQRRD